MSDTPRILAFAGSTRSDSYNKRLVQIALHGAQQAGAITTFIDLKDYPMPLYDEDHETANGLPENAIKLKALFQSHHGFLLASPEYNSSISGVLKNTIDWLSRPYNDEPALACFRGKVAALMSASPGSLGGLRGLVHIRAILGNIGVIVLPDQVAISMAHQAFTPDGQLQNPKQQESIQNLGHSVSQMLQKLL